MKLVATPGELVRVVAASLGVPETLVLQADRKLSEAGLRSKGGRGRSSVRITARDAASLLIAIGAGSMAKDTVTTLKDYAGLPRAMRKTEPRPASGWDLSQMPVAPLKALPVEHDLASSLAALITAAADDTLARAALTLSEVTAGNRGQGKLLDIEVRFLGPDPQGLITIKTPAFQESNFYVEPIPDDIADLPEWQVEHRHRHGGGDAFHIHGFTGRTIFEVGRCLAS